MRDLAKSVMRLSWALSSFGARQTANVLNPGSWGDASAAMDTVSLAAEEGLGETVSGVYRAGRQLQDGVVDAVVDLTSRSWTDPRAAFNQAWQAIDRSWATGAERTGD